MPQHGRVTWLWWLLPLAVVSVLSAVAHRREAARASERASWEMVIGPRGWRSRLLDVGVVVCAGATGTAAADSDAPFRWVVVAFVLVGGVPAAVARWTRRRGSHESPAHHPPSA